MLSVALGSADGVRQICSMIPKQILMKKLVLFLIFFIPGISAHAQKVTLGTLLGEMDDLTRLTYLSDYKTVQ